MFLKRSRELSLKRKVRIYFFTGLVVSLPVLGSLWILFVLFFKVTDFLYQYVTPMGIDHFWQKLLWRLVALLILFMATIFIGLVAQNYLGRKLIAVGEYIFSKVPVLNRVYALLKQIFESFWGKDKANSRSVVLVEFPRDGMYSMGFMTSESRGEIRERLGEGLVNVFIPTAPNPTTGFFIIVPKDKLIMLKISSEDALKMIVSTGVVSPKNAVT